MYMNLDILTNTAIHLYSTSGPNALLCKPALNTRMLINIH